jgi:hypothetical protein
LIAQTEGESKLVQATGEQAVIIHVAQAHVVTAQAWAILEGYHFGRDADFSQRAEKLFAVVGRRLGYGSRYIAQQLMEQIVVKIVGFHPGAAKLPQAAPNVALQPADKGIVVGKQVLAMANRQHGAQQWRDVVVAYPYRRRLAVQDGTPCRRSLCGREIHQARFRCARIDLGQAAARSISAGWPSAPSLAPSQ